jgi:transcriptional regulator with XRE-family HTH domain
MIVGERLRLVREREDDMSQSALARLVGMTPSAISQIESGTSKKPSADNLMPIAKALRVNPEWLMTGKGYTYTIDTLGDRIHAARMESGMTMAQVASKGRWAEGDFLRWENDEEVPPKKTINYMANILDFHPDWPEAKLHVVEISEPPTQPYGLSPAESAMIEKYRRMTADKQTAAQTVFDALAQSEVSDG